MLINEIPLDERMITDQQVFDAFNLDHPGLNLVKKALADNNLPEAKAQLIRYMEKRTAPHFLFDYRALPLTPIDTDSCPYSFQSSLGLSESLKDFCLYVGKQMMNHIYVLPGGRHRQIDLGKNWENMIHFNFYEDMGKKHRNPLNMIVRGQFFESLCVLYHETGDRKVLESFEEVLNVFFETYPLTITHYGPSVSRFQYTEDRDVMSVGWLAIVYISLFYTRVPYEIPAETAFEILKRIWFLGIQFSRFDKDSYRPYNHHMWERGLVPFILGVMFPEIPDFAAMKEWGAPIVCRHIKEDFNTYGGYSEHSIAYWSGAAVGEMLYRGIYLARLNEEPLLDDEAEKRIVRTFHILAMLCPPGERYPSLGDNGGPMPEPILGLGVRMLNHPECRQVLETRRNQAASDNGNEASALSLDYCCDQAGFVCAKSGYDSKSNYMLMSAKVDCGYCGHNHMDMLSLFLTIRGEEIIGEPYARHMYHRVRMDSEIRGYMYNMPSHNTVLAYGSPIVPNKMYANKWGVMRPSSPVTESHSYDQGFYVNAFHDGYTFCRHRRELLFHRQHGIIISDHILRGNRLNEPHIQRWNLMPGAKATVTGPHTLIVEKKGVRLLFLWTGAEHQITLTKAELLVPEMFPTMSDLAEVIDVFFYPSPAHKHQDETVTLNLLILDITGQTVDEAVVTALTAQLDTITPDLNRPEALEAFPTPQGTDTSISG